MKPRRVQRPTLVETLSRFAEIDNLFDQFATGEVMIEDDKPVFKALGSGEWHFVADALDGWIELWARVIRRFSLTINIGPLAALTGQLRDGTEVDPHLVDQCRAAINECRRAYRTIDINLFNAVIRDTRIGLRFEEMGLTERAAA